MALQQRVCPGCGGPVAKSTSRCERCGAWFEEEHGSDMAGGTKAASALKSFFQRLPPDAGEFGLGGMLPLAAGFAMACVLYAVGWFMEDTDYWLAPGAVALWGAVLPIWLGMVASLWRTQRAAWPVGLGIALIMLAIHLGIVWLIRQRINDDMLGIAAMYSALALVGWLLGRLGHLAMRRQRIRHQAE